MSKVFTIDINRCNGCRNCQIVCKDEHCEQTWLPYSEAQPLTGHFWMNVKETVRGQVPWVRVSYQPTFCAHCSKDAPCIQAAADAGVPEAVYRRDDGLVILDPEKAQGMKELADCCPLGVIYWNEKLELAQKCNACAHLLDNGWEAPRCVDACPTDALLYKEMSAEELLDFVSLEQVQDYAPLVSYRNLPKRFIAGTVYSSFADEVIKNEKVKLVDSSGVVIDELLTDSMGDFKFDQIEKGVYTVVVDKVNLEADVRNQDLSLGDIDIS